ncbi:MAG: hypothetical protein DRI44_09195 [Chlamydiae bacterium]|nr:MAG: hypothetical protein DRI44_09195 [Chlamydiota bacterium]
MTKKDLLEKAFALNITSVTVENTNAEIEAAINAELANPTPAGATPSAPAKAKSAKGNVKYIKYPDGTEVVVKAEDAEAHAFRIESERQPPDDMIKNGKAKRFRVQIIDEPSYEGGERTE